MDRNEQIQKMDELRDAMKRRDFDRAVDIADSLDLKRIKDNNILSLVADAYEVTHNFEEAKEALTIAYENTNAGRLIAYKLCLISVKAKDFAAARSYYEDFIEMAPRDTARYILRYRMAKAQGKPIEELINILEEYVNLDMEEKWAYELAKLYYKAGKKVARWIKFDELGDTLKIESYDNDELNGLSVTFGTKGQRLKEYNYRNDKKHGICKDLDYETGAVKREGEYENGKLNGKEKVLVVSNQFDFIETTTYLKGHRHGPYEAIYVKNGQLREKGEYKNDYKIGRWSRYDINGKLEKEWDE